MKQWWKLSIAKKIFGSFLLVLIPVTLLSLGTNYISMEIVKREITSSYSSSLEILGKQFDNSLTKLEYISRVVVTDEDLNAIDESPDDTKILWNYVEILKRLRFFSETNDLQSNITIYLRNKQRSFSSENGMNTIKSSDNIDIFGANDEYIDKWIFRNTSKEGGKRVLSYVGNSWYMNSGKNIAVTIDINISEIKNLLSNLQTQEGKNAFLLSPEGDIVIPDNTLDINVDNFKKAIIKTKDIMGQLSFKQNNQKYNVIYYKSDYTNLIIGLYYPETQIMKPIIKIQNWIYLVLLTSICLAIFFALSINQNILYPIYKLIDGMTRVKEGNLKVRITDGQKEEFGFLYTQFNTMVSQIDSLFNEVYMERLKQNQAQLKLLQSQINPHFLYNCLNYIYQMSMGENTEGAAKMSLYLGKYFRFATKSNNDIVPLNEEFDNIDSYIQIQKMRYLGKFEYYMEIPEGIQNICIPRLTIQPLVENAIVHGVEETDRKVNIWIRGNIVENKVVIIVENDGASIAPDKLEQICRVLRETDCEETNHGLYNTNLRLKLRYGEKAGISIEQRYPEGTKITVTIPKVEVIRDV